MIRLKLLTISFVTFLAPVWVAAQISFPDTLFVASAIKQAKEVYNQSVKDHSHLYSGKEYVEPKKKMPEVGIPFFVSEDWEEGQVMYDGELYENVAMRYDLVREKLIVEHKGYGEVELINEKIKYFVMAGHTFVRLENVVINKSALSPGFYDKIYDGPSKVFVKRIKVTEEKIETQFSMTLTFKEKNSLFVLKNGVYHALGNKGSALSVFDDQKSALKKLLSKNKIKYRKNREGALIKIAGHYDEITR